MNFLKYNTRINIVRTFMIRDDDQNRMFVCCENFKGRTTENIQTERSFSRLIYQKILQRLSRL